MNNTYLFNLDIV